MLEEYAKYGKPIHLSEVTMLSSELFKDWRELQAMEARIKAARKSGEKPPARPSTPEGEKRQAQAVRDFYTLAFSHPSVDAIVWWSVTDQGAWRGSAGGLVDADMDPKPAYKALDQLINHDWRTSAKVATDELGRITFRGFHGAYAVRMTYNGKQAHGTFRLSSGGSGPVRVSMQPNSMR